MDAIPLKVSEINKYIKKIFSGDPILSDVCVEGEISNFKHHYSGHMYFTLKDEKSKIKCVMFKRDNQLVNIDLKDGKKVILLGYISIYERNGDYQLYVKKIKDNGVGKLYLELEKLKDKLDREGLFDDNNKKKLPFFPTKIGVVTSSTGAAIRDIITVLKRRFPIVNILIYPVQVQGKNAANEICEGLKYFDNRTDIDLIIVGRGGGAFEELFAFNEEVVVRTIFSLRIPVISAVGHEIDYTLSDFVSDLRAPTPSAGAELAVPDLNTLKSILKDNFFKLNNCIKSIIDEKIKLLIFSEEKLNYYNPQKILNENKQLLDNYFKHLNSNFENKINKCYINIENLYNKLKILNPICSMERGFGVVFHKNGEIIKSVDDIKENNIIYIKLKDGIIRAKVGKIKKGEYDDEF